ncbi:AzlD family protein [Halorarius halobius]|uniref:AzlD family protein n=1 Tax=Halorarius halobius TaxID=2962671 RepID=UPI0020CBD123|nr:AzlD domain-containing protein [Halorarius halobius]
MSSAAIAAVVGMSVVTYATKTGGYWVLDRIEPSETTREALDALPGGIVVAFLAVRLLRGGPPEWVAGAAVVAVAHRTDSILLAMVAGVGVLLAVRHVLA